METLPQHLFDRDAYLAINSDVAKSGMDPYVHYITHGIAEGRMGDIDYSALNLEQLKCFYYHTITDSNIECEENKKLWTVPFYLKSNFVAHFPLLEYYGSNCNHITEFGVGQGHSTIAFLFSVKGQLESYDMEESKFTKWLKSRYLNNWTFHSKPSNMAETDLIFFSNYSFYESLKTEIAVKARKYLIFHKLPKTMAEPTYKGYRIVYKTKECNGLLVLEKV